MVLVVIGPYLVKLVIDRAILPDQPSLLLPLVGLLLLVGLLKAVGIGGRRLFGFILSYRAETDLRNRLFEHLQRLAFSFHDRVATGELMARSSTDLSQVRLVFAMLPITVANIALVATTVVVLILLDPLLGVVASLAIPALFLLAARYARRVTRLSFDVQQRLADLASVVEEGISGIRVVKAFGAEAATVRRVDRAADGIFRRSMELLRIRSANVPIFELIPAAGTLAVLWLGGYLVIDGRITLGDFVAFTQYLVLLVFPLRMTAWFFAELPRASAVRKPGPAAARHAPDVTDPDSPSPLPRAMGTSALPMCRSPIREGHPSSPGSTCTYPRVLARRRWRRRFGQDHARLPHSEVLRRDLGRDADRWRRRPSSPARRAAARGRRRLRGPLPLLVDDPGEHRVRRPRRHRRAGEAGRSARSRPRVHRGPPRRLRHGGRRAATRSLVARGSG